MWLGRPPRTLGRYFFVRRNCLDYSLVFLGYFFGNIPIVKNNLTVAILGIIVLSLMPGIIHFVREKTRGSSPRT